MLLSLVWLLKKKKENPGVGWYQRSSGICGIRVHGFLFCFVYFFLFSFSFSFAAYKLATSAWIVIDCDQRSSRTKYRAIF
jgi:hypothetical protein